MADQKLSDLPDVPLPILGGDLLYIVRTPDSYKTTVDELAAAVPALATAWGEITGTLSNQTDLNTALGLKAPLASPALTGTPTAPTAAPGTSTTQIATTAFDAASIVAERTATATLTNKTLTAPVVNSPTGIVKADVGLGSVDNTSDANKPVSTAAQTALNLKADLASPAFTGTPVAPNAAADTTTTQLATTAFVIGQAGGNNPVIDGTAAPGTSKKYSREDHVHPTDTSRAALASPTFTGTPAAPTASAGTNSTQIATTAFVAAATTRIIQAAASDVTTAITAGTNKVTFRVPYAMTLTGVRASVQTAPTGSTIIIDINKNGTTVLSTKLSIDASEKTSVTAATPPVISVSAFADDDEVEIDFDQVGSTIAGKEVVITLIGTPP